MRKWIVAAGILAFGAAAYAYAQSGSEAPKANIGTAIAEIADVQTTVLASGTIQPFSQVAVGAQTSGRVVSLKVSLGQRVEAGDLLALIDDMPQSNSLRNAKANLAALTAQRDERQANLEYAEAVLARQKSMIAQNAVSRDAYEQSEANVRAIRAQIANLEAQASAAQVQVDTAQVNLGYTRITAPISGTVLSVVTQAGQTVNSVQSAPTIVVLGDVGTVTIKARISEADVTQLRKGQEVTFTTLGAPGERREASLRFVEPAPDSLRTENANSNTATAASTSTTAAVYYNGLFDVPNPDGRLLTSMTVQVTVVTGQAKGVLSIPSIALRRSGSRTTVEVVAEDGSIETRPVTVGLDDKARVEIKSGLKAGERVVAGRAEPGSTSPSRRRSPMGF